MKKLATALRFALPLALGILAVGPALAADPIVIKLSHVVSVDTSKGRGAEQFKKLAEERTKGRVQVLVYPNSQLYKDKEELEALQLGSVHMLIPSLSKFGPLGVKEFEVFDLPFLFPGFAEVHKITDGPLGRQMLDKLEPRGIKGLAFWDNGFKVMSANKPLTLSSDAKGLKLRIQSSKVLEAQMRTLGALPQTMAFSEVYQALQTGVIDGTEQTPTQSYSQRFHEVQKHYTATNHGYLGYAVVVNKKFWDGLPPDVRSALDSAMRDATVFVNQLTEKENEDDLKRIAASGKASVTQLTAQQRDAWRQALLPTYGQVESRLPKTLVEAIRKEIGGK
ncbi:TRAP transporter substrate-binding protein [Dechloromonas sp. ARDL1]|uniref:TRAP transporter substrate-binding protein n=1 Tax=Dechloromonas sp. ARDL1 TaxID=3322121 RepID=UPI003DA7206D